MKRVLDLALAGAALVVGGPLLVALSVAVKLDSPGPAFFIQKRIGRGRRTIRVAKLRTMVDRPDGSGPKVTAAHDPRVTRIGRFLRRTKLDELPQLWNVVRGEMSLVGPRPQRPAEVELYSPREHLRLNMKPGLTGLWQVNGRSDLEWDLAVKFDLKYVRSWSLGADAAILARTVKVVVSGSGAT